MNRRLFVNRSPLRPIDEMSSRSRFAAFKARRQESFDASDDATGGYDPIGFWPWLFGRILSMTRGRQSATFEDYVHDELDKAYRSEQYMCDAMRRIQMGKETKPS